MYGAENIGEQVRATVEQGHGCGQEQWVIGKRQKIKLIPKKAGWHVRTS